MKNLCRAIIWSVCFLELSDDDIVDSHAAVKAMEDIATALREASEEEKQAFMAVCAEEADHLQETPGYRQTADFVRSLPAAVGL